jgi:hypothetical protein
MTCNTNIPDVTIYEESKVAGTANSVQLYFPFSYPNLDNHMPALVLNKRDCAKNQSPAEFDSFEFIKFTHYRLTCQINLMTYPG